MPPIGDNTGHLRAFQGEANITNESIKFYTPSLLLFEVQYPLKSQMIATLLKFSCLPQFFLEKIVEIYDILQFAAILRLMLRFIQEAEIEKNK